MDLIKVFALILIISTCFIMVGLLVANLLKESEIKTSKMYLIGLITTLSIFWAIAIPMDYFNASFSVLAISFWFIIFTLVFISVMHTKKQALQMIIASIKTLKNVSLTTVIVTIILLIQLYLILTYGFVTEDDSYYIAQANSAFDTNCLSQFDMWTGSEYGIYWKYFLAPWPYAIATFSKLVNLRPVITARNVVLVIMYIASIYSFYHVGKLLLKESHKAWQMLGMITLLNFFGQGGSAGLATQVCIYVGMWQGKALCNWIGFPLIWYFVIQAMGNEEKKDRIRNYVYLGLTVIFTLCVNASTAPLVPMLLGCVALVYAIKRKSLKPIAMAVLLSLPNVLGALFVYINR